MNEVQKLEVKQHTEQAEFTAPDGSDLHRWLLESLQFCERSTAEVEYRKTANEDYKFYAGKQDDPDVIAYLESQKRPCPVFNEIKPKIDMLIGLAAQAQRAPTCVAVGMEDQAATDIANAALKHYRYNLKVARKEIECFEHVTKGGRSFLHYYVDNENPYIPRIKSKRIDGRFVWVDPNCREYDLEDARFMFIDGWLQEEEIKDLFGDENFSPMAPPVDLPTFFNEDNKKYRVVECWYRKREKVHWFINPLTNQPEWLLPKDFARFEDVLAKGLRLPDGRSLQIPKGALQNVIQPKMLTFYAIISGDRILTQGVNPYKHESFPYVQCAGYKDDDTNAYFSAITMMKDPQRAINTLRRQLIHLLNTAPRGILMHEVGAILNIEEYEQKAADPTYHMELASGAIEKVKFSSQPQISPVYQTQDAVMVQSVKDSSGVQDSLMGIQTTSREPGVTVKMRQEASIAVLFLLFDNFREFRLNSAKMLLSMIQQYVDTPLLLRIEGPEGEQLVQANQGKGINDLSLGEFDIRVDETVENATIRGAIAQMLTEFAQTNPGSIPPQIIMEYAGLPTKVRQEIAVYQQQQAEAAAASAEEERKHQLELEALRAQTQITTATIQTEGRNDERKRRTQSGSGDSAGRSGGRPVRGRPEAGG